MKIPFVSISLLASAVQAQQDAPVAENNVMNLTYRATFQLDKKVQGYISTTNRGNGTGVNFNINFYDFPDASLGPFIYHIHEKPVPTDGNCTGTGAHLDPYLRTESPPCNSSAPETCQVGDLSGKHGAINDTKTTPTFQRLYQDLYLSTVPGDPAFFGNLSIVVHVANKTRLNCANFTLEIEGSNATNTTSTSSATASTTTTAETASETSGSASATASTTPSSPAGSNAGVSSLTVWSTNAVLGIAVTVLGLLGLGT